MPTIGLGIITGDQHVRIYLSYQISQMHGSPVAVLIEVVVISLGLISPRGSVVSYVYSKCIGKIIPGWDLTANSGKRVILLIPTARDIMNDLPSFSTLTNYQLPPTTTTTNHKFATLVF